MNFQKIIPSIIICLWANTLWGQEIQGSVRDANNNPLIGSSVYWSGTAIGTSTDIDGIFTISLTDESNTLVASYVGYTSDSIEVNGKQNLVFKLSESTALGEVTARASHPDKYVMNRLAIKTEVLTQTELTKAACCDLAGCFETQASIQPATTNVVTNAKELRILGVAGVYNQVLIDGFPLIHGLSSVYGVGSIPGASVNTITVAKGANSVLQGHEGIAGQTNVLMKRPGSEERLFVNLFGNQTFERQLNVNYWFPAKHWAGLASVHVAQPGLKHDGDGDGFMDAPQISRYSAYGRWEYGKQADWGWHSTVGMRFVNEERIGGQMSFEPSRDRGGSEHYGQTVRFSQPEAYSKTGYRFDSRNYIALFASGFYHGQESYFGATRYQGTESNAYFTAQYEWRYSREHTLKAGLSGKASQIDEEISLANDTFGRSYAGKYRNYEYTPGVFAENSFSWKQGKIELLTGLRADRHNSYGTFVTPRALIKYSYDEFTTLRISAGTGWRSVQVFSENTALLASSRDIVIERDILPEQAFNYGVNLMRSFRFGEFTPHLSFDYYRTEIKNQVFPDYESIPGSIYIGNFSGRSVSNALQAELTGDITRRVNLVLAYNFLDVYRVEGSEHTELPFNARHKWTSSLSFKPLNKKYHLDVNAHLFGAKRLPQSYSSQSGLSQPEKSDRYTVVNIQATKKWKHWDLYVGCENIFDFRQEKPIIGWEDPFGSDFDASRIWGPTKGREFYVGLRYRL